MKIKGNIKYDCQRNWPSERASSGQARTIEATKLIR